MNSTSILAIFLELPWSFTIMMRLRIEERPSSAECETAVNDNKSDRDRMGSSNPQVQRTPVTCAPIQNRLTPSSVTARGVIHRRRMFQHTAVKTINTSVRQARGAGRKREIWLNGRRPRHPSIRSLFVRSSCCVWAPPN